jgi:hypothetical protein
MFYVHVVPTVNVDARQKHSGMTVAQVLDRQKNHIRED